jgi:hypothetical protein
MLLPPYIGWDCILLILLSAFSFVKLLSVFLDIIKSYFSFELHDFNFLPIAPQTSFAFVLSRAQLTSIFWCTFYLFLLLFLEEIDLLFQLWEHDVSTEIYLCIWKFINFLDWFQNEKKLILVHSHRA